ncbi:MAG: hypothetical protein FWE09_06020, partial [Treponema sp.]|nr:hypothetical protein [Treponema sp.]
FLAGAEPSVDERAEQDAEKEKEGAGPDRRGNFPNMERRPRQSFRRMADSDKDGGRRGYPGHANRPAGRFSFKPTRRGPE